MKPASALPSTDPLGSVRTVRATVVDVPNDRRVEVRTVGSGSLRSAVVAAHGYNSPIVGDEVLAIIDGEETFVVGVIRALRPAPTTRTRSYEVEDAEGRLLFRYDPGTGESEVFVPQGDLRFRVPEGRLELEARDGVSIDGDEKVELRSGVGVEIKAGMQSGEERATVVVNPERVGASAPELLIAAGRAQVVSSQASLISESLETKVDRARHVARVIETQAHRVVEKTKYSYREVERLAQLKAARIRSIAETSAQLLAERIVMRSKKDTKIRGKKIYLA